MHVCRSGIAVLVVAATTLVWAGPPAGKGKAPSRGSPGRPEAPHRGAEAEARPAPSLRFTAREIEVVRNWFRDPRHREGLPPGLAKRSDLPPGLERQLRRNGRLPPGLEAKLHPLPNDLEILLPRLPTGVRRAIVGGDLLLLDERSSAILDIARGVVRLADTL